MVRAADVTVLGTVKSGSRGVEYVSTDGDERYVEADVHLKVSVDETLAGKVGDGSGSVTVVLGPFDDTDVDSDLWGDLIGRQAVFALRRSGTEVVTDWGTKPADPKLFEQNLYYVVYSRGLLEAAPDSTTVAPWSEPDGWITKVTGQPFADVLDDIRKARSEQ